MDARRIERVALISLEPWDEVMRRNQHLALRLIESGVASHLTFVEPVAGGVSTRSHRREVADGIEALTPPSLVPRRLEGHLVTGAWLKRQLRDVEVVWINDPTLGLASAPRGKPLLYDVTDDWRSMSQPESDRRRVVHAEDVLAQSARTVVCSAELANRWRRRYNIEPAIVQNGVDISALDRAEPIVFTDPGPHAVYVGTLHRSRVDIALVERLAATWPGTIHAVGPTDLNESEVIRLRRSRVHLHGRQAASQVPRFLVGADILICPHLVDDFTLSLDAIKSHEFLATDKPVVATASSGFQSLSAPGLWVATRDEFAAAAVTALASGLWKRSVAVDWRQRAAQFGQQLSAACRVTA